MFTLGRGTRDRRELQWRRGVGGARLIPVRSRDATATSGRWNA